jgi:hypothetical protein
MLYAKRFLPVGQAAAAGATRPAERTKPVDDPGPLKDIFDS